MPIFYLAPVRQTSGIDEYLGFWGRDMASRMRVLHYQDLPALTALEPGTYILAALDQLDPDTLRFVRDLHRHFDGRRGFRFLNHPASTLHRLPLLNELHRRGLNDFRAVRAGGDLAGLRFPVFLRSRRAHDGAISPLLRSVGEIEDAIGRAAFRGRRLRELLVVEFCATADEDGRYRKFAAFRVGGRIVPRHLVCGRDWMLKLDGGESSASAVQEELEYVRDNPHRRALAEIFRIANVGYGRIDYSLQGDRVQTWEINLNPVIGPAVSPAHRAPKNELFYGAFRAALERLVCTPRGSSAVALPAAARRRAPSEPLATSPPARGLRVRFEPGHPLIESLLRPLLPWVGRLARRLSADLQSSPGGPRTLHRQASPDALTRATDWRPRMARCIHCGNDYDKTFEVVLSGGERHTFDSFECAIHALAPTCQTCGVRIIGHGLEDDGRFFCCDHCAEKAGVHGLKDRV